MGIEQISPCRCWFGFSERVVHIIGFNPPPPPIPLGPTMFTIIRDVTTNACTFPKTFRCIEQLSIEILSH